MDKRVGNYSFIIGVIIAIIIGILGSATPAQTGLASLLVVLGLIVGFLNVVGKETKEFLIVSAVLIIATAASIGGAGATLSGVTIIGQYLQGILAQVLAFIVPATVVVALKDIWRISQTG